jgi:hypothetical protein
MLTACIFQFTDTNCQIGLKKQKQKKKDTFLLVFKEYTSPVKTQPKYEGMKKRYFKQMKHKTKQE